MTTETGGQSAPSSLPCSTASVEVDVWELHTEHDEEKLLLRDPEELLTAMRERIDDWMRSPIGDPETITVTVGYRSVPRPTIEEWQNHGLID